MPVLSSGLQAAADAIARQAQSLGLDPVQSGLPIAEAPESARDQVDALVEAGAARLDDGVVYLDETLPLPGPGPDPDLPHPVPGTDMLLTDAELRTWGEDDSPTEHD
jgi:hypothetical protein